MQKSADAVIVGGGVMGCSILYNLVAGGMKDVALLEQGVLASGSTGKSQAICRMHYSNEVTSRMARESLKLYKHFQDVVGGPSGFVTTGYLVIVNPEDKRALEDNVSIQRALGINTVLISREDVRELAPILDVLDVEGLAYEPESGYADPYLVTTSYANGSTRLGARVHMNAPVTDVSIVGGRVTAVTTEQGRIETPVVVIATGPWARRSFARLGLDMPLSTTRHQVIAIRRPEELVPTHPSVGDIAQQFSFRPDSGGLTFIGAGEDDAEPDTYDQGVDMAVAKDAFAKLVRRIPAMSQGFFRGGWSGLFTVTPDWHPILGNIEGIQGLYAAVGFSGHGFKLAPMVGVAIAELILEGGAKTVDVTPLRLGRFREGELLRSRYTYNVIA